MTVHGAQSDHKRLAQQQCDPEPFASAHPERRCEAPKSKDAQDKLREGFLREILRVAQNDTIVCSPRQVSQGRVFRFSLIAILVLGLAAGCDQLPGKPTPAERWQPATAVTAFSQLYAQNCSG